MSAAEARCAVVLVHGRGASARGMLALRDEIGLDRVAYRAPQASGMTWYPQSFLAPLRYNEEGIRSGINAVMSIVSELERDGLPPERVVLLGFSQGACLVLESAARNPRRYGGVVGLSGGLIGTGQIDDASPPNDKRFEYDGSLNGTPVFLGCSDVDSHIPVERVHRTAEVVELLGGKVEVRIYDGMGHTINDDELTAVREIVETVGSS